MCMGISMKREGGMCCLIWWIRWGRSFGRVNMGRWMLLGRGWWVICCWICGGWGWWCGCIGRFWMGVGGVWLMWIMIGRWLGRWIRSILFLCSLWGILGWGWGFWMGGVIMLLWFMMRRWGSWWLWLLIGGRFSILILIWGGLELLGWMDWWLRGGWYRLGVVVVMLSIVIFSLVGRSFG